MENNMFIIEDWTGNVAVTSYQFDSFEDAEEYLEQFFEDEGLNYDEERGEYSIVNTGGLV